MAYESPFSIDSVKTAQSRLFHAIFTPIANRVLLISNDAYMIYVRESQCFQHFVWARPPANVDCVISIAYGPEKSEKYKKTEKSYNGGIRPIISQMVNFEISVLFRRDRTSQFFFDIFLIFSGL